MESEKEKMLSGKMYRASDPLLIEERQRAHALCRAFNADPLGDRRAQARLLAHFAETGDDCWIESPFLCDYAYNITIGDRFYANFNVTILDCAPVTIGSDVKLGPGVQLYTAGHALDPNKRRAGDEFALPITLGDNVWIGGSAIVLPGVTIGPNAVVGAGSVVTRDVPSGATVMGNPARVR